MSGLQQYHGFALHHGPNSSTLSAYFFCLIDSCFRQFAGLSSTVLPCDRTCEVALQEYDFWFQPNFHEHLLVVVNVTSAAC